MPADRYVLLGLARPRAEWFRAVGQWSSTAAIPAEFAKCVSVAELQARLASGRRHSAVLLDGGLPAIDRDVLDAAREAGCAVVVVDDGLRASSWSALGVAAVLPPSFSREALLDALATHAVLVGGATTAVVDGLRQDGAPVPLGLVAAVCGPGGTGASTTAAALAQGLGAGGRHGDVLLADLARHGEQAMLHDVRDVAPGLQEVVDAHRSGWPADDELRTLLFHVVDRHYQLLLGLRRARYWSTLRPRAFDAAFESLRRLFGVTVCDITADFEGERDGGSVDVEERNHVARATVGLADVVFVVARPGVKGMHALVRVLGELAATGVPAGRVVPVVNLAPRHPKARAEIVATLAELAPPAMGGGSTTAPLFLPARKVDESWRDGAPLPGPLPSTLARAFDATVQRLGPLLAAPAEPELVVPGSLGSWSADE